ncbi:MAG: hypothetical protein ACT4N4_03235 [Rhodospirillales bacterium]
MRASICLALCVLVAVPVWGGAAAGPAWGGEAAKPAWSHRLEPGFYAEIAQARTLTLSEARAEADEFRRFFDVVRSRPVVAVAEGDGRTLALLSGPYDGYTAARAVCRDLAADARPCAVRQIVRTGQGELAALLDEPPARPSAPPPPPPARPRGSGVPQSARLPLPDNGACIGLCRLFELMWRLELPAPHGAVPTS